MIEVIRQLSPQRLGGEGLYVHSESIIEAQTILCTCQMLSLSFMC